MRSSVLPVALLLVSAFALSSCGGDRPENCPDTSMLASASIVSIMRDGTAPDPANELYTVQLGKVTSTCRLSEEDRTSEEDVEIKFRATRSSSGEAATYTVPFFVAVAQAGKVVSKKPYMVQVSFQAGETVTKVDQDIDSVVINVDRDKHAIDYQVLVGLQLTKEQLEYNQAHGRYAQ
ncbi:MAG: hypothetical protein HY243_02940 [Proteobacteria bacterium]|nr:hypothetical protein [Pseudomonadota bacterium]